MFVRDYMTRDPIVVSPEVSHPEALSLMRKHTIGRLPVISHGKLVGIVSEEDLLSNQPSPATTLSVYEIYALLSKLRMKDIMVHPVVTVAGDCPMEEAACIMIQRNIGCLPVVEDDKLIGLITESDIFRALMEVLGGKDVGHRVVVRIPERVGELARLSAEIAQAGGNIVAITNSRLLPGGYREVMIKDSGITLEALKQVLERDGVEIVDMREPTPYEPKLIG